MVYFTVPKAQVKPQFIFFWLAEKTDGVLVLIGLKVLLCFLW